MKNKKNNKSLLIFSDNFDVQFVYAIGRNYIFIKALILL